MRILFEINHPAHFHLFKNTIDELIKQRNHVYVLAKSNYPIPELIATMPNWTVIFEGYKGKNLFQKFIKQFFFTYLAVKVVIKNKIDICVGVSITMPQVAFLTGRKSLVLDDDDQNVTPVFAILSHSFASIVMSPDSVKRLKLKKYRYYKGFHELAYLHPEIFKPRKIVLKELNLDLSKNIFLVRFNSFNAHHDIGEKGMSFEQRKILIDHLSKLGQVIISSESDLNPYFSKFKFPISPDKIHDLMAFSTIFIGESQTMASEAAILGIPSIRINSFKNRISYLNELEKDYNLLFSFLPSELDKAILKINEILNLKSCNTKMNNKLFKDKINLTSLIKSTIYEIYNQRIIKQN